MEKTAKKEEKRVRSHTNYIFLQVASAVCGQNQERPQFPLPCILPAGPISFLFLLYLFPLIFPTSPTSCLLFLYSICFSRALPVGPISCLRSSWSHILLLSLYPVYWPYILPTSLYIFTTSPISLLLVLYLLPLSSFLVLYPSWISLCLVPYILPYPSLVLSLFFTPSLAPLFNQDFFIDFLQRSLLVLNQDFRNFRKIHRKEQRIFSLFNSGNTLDIENALFLSIISKTI